MAGAPSTVRREAAAGAETEIGSSWSTDGSSNTDLRVIVVNSLTLIRSYAYTLPHRDPQNRPSPTKGAESLFGTLRREPQTCSKRSSTCRSARTASEHDRRRGPRRRRRAPSGCSSSSPSLMHDGYKLGKGDVKTAAQLVAQDENVELADYFLRGAPRDLRQAAGDAEERQPAPLPRSDRAARHRVRHRPGGHRQDLPGDGAGRRRTCSPSASAASSWRGRRSKRGRSSASCPATCRKR